MVLLYPIESLKHTVFEDEYCLAFFREHGVLMTSNISEADVFLLRKTSASTIIDFQKYLMDNGIPPKPILVWTHEPRFAKTDLDRIDIEGFCSLHVMNLYTRTVYFSNLTFYGSNVDRLLTPRSDVSFSKIPIVALAGYVSERSSEMMLNGLNIDLTVKRQKLLLKGSEVGLIAIYGRNWPDSMNIFESRGAGWHQAKLNILEKYQFNVAMENTSFDYYCTEKIWDSIKSYCLPIYSSYNNKIYDLFPKNSFIDVDEFSGNDELLKYLKMMSKKEYLGRLNSCVQVFNHVYETTDMRSEKQQSLTAIIDKLGQIVG